MKALLAVLTAMIAIMDKQNKLLLSIQAEVKLDNESELTDIDFAALNEQLNGVIALPDTLG
ncbi:MAG: hypothetical protein P2A85_09180 [Microcoleus anatoxicus]|uniref:hypothetical protein n=1 Tax=Microcoleus anatoxicus TaxID=2705319 RepID=UPI00366C8268